MVIQCCVCQKVQDGNEWIAVEESYLATRHISHTYCPICKKASLDDLQELRVHRYLVPQV